MDLAASEKLAKCVGQFPHESVVERLSALGVGVIQAIVHSLRNNIVKFLKELLLRFFVESSVLN